jgi:6-phosphogluconolactonase
MSIRKVVSNDAQAAAEACAREIMGLLDAARRERDRATLAISGGSSPKALFAFMAKAQFNWSGVHLFWVDERCVPPGDEQSNFKLAKDYLIGPAKISERQVHRVIGEMEPRAAAERYSEEIRDFFGIAGPGLPRFDVIHRGIGPDAHTASLFPGDQLIDDTANIAAATFVPKFNQWRVTLLPGVLAAARHTVVLATGADKAEALGHVFGPEYEPKKYPSQIGIRDGQDMSWYLT